MELAILLTAVVLVLCVFSDRLSGKIGVPALLIFIIIGILFGSDGIIKIPFEDYSFASHVCETALIIIMFTGGFAVKWETAKPVVVKACLMSTLGVVITALSTMLFCRFVLGFSWTEGFLMSSVISSTDAASVFSVLRSRRLNLKNGIAPLLEVESGSNDPFSYMLTVIALALLEGQNTGFVWYLIFAQLVFGVVCGAAVGILTVIVVKKFNVSAGGFEQLLFIAAALLAYSLPTLISGNGYLSVYIAGIIIGNAKIQGKREAVLLLDGITGLCQIAVFFLLGLLSTPSTFIDSLIPAMLIFLCLNFIARPLAIVILGGKSPIKDRIFINLAGLRGASSIVFAIMAVTANGATENNIFNIVFMVCLMSMLLQGSLLPAAAKKLDLIDNNADVLKTFNDYKEEAAITMMRMFVPAGHAWENKQLCEVELPTGSLAVMIKRGDETVIPRGNTIIRAEDSVVLSVPPYESDKTFKLREIHIGRKHKWKNLAIRDLVLPERLLIVMIKREGESVIPFGSTQILENDIVVVNELDESVQISKAN